MTRAELIGQLGDADGSDEVIFVSESDLGELTAKDLPEGVMLSVGTLKEGVTQIEWEGHFHKKNGELTAYCEYVWTRKYWDEPLGMPFYLDLVKRAVETRGNSHGDVRFEDWDDDGAFIQLSYEFTDLPDNLRDAHKEVMGRNKRLQEAADALSEQVG